MMDPTMKKARKVSAVRNPDIYNYSDNRSSFLPHIKSKIDFLMNRWLFFQAGIQEPMFFLSCGSIATCNMKPPAAMPACIKLAVRGKNMENEKSYGSVMGVGHIPSTIFLWLELSYFINPARGAAERSLKSSHQTSTGDVSLQESLQKAELSVVPQAAKVPKALWRLVLFGPPLWGNTPLQFQPCQGQNPRSHSLEISTWVRWAHSYISFSPKGQGLDMGRLHDPKGAYRHPSLTIKKT